VGLILLRFFFCLLPPPTQSIWSSGAPFTFFMMAAQARGWEQRILRAATEATNGAWLVKKGWFEAMRLEAHRFGRPT
jgi:hypothetical protein